MPVLIFDPSFPSAEVFGGAYAEIREEVVAEFQYATIVLTGMVLPVKDFTAIAAPLAESRILKRSTAYSATFSRSPDSTAEIGVGPSACASGSHACSGANPTFVP